MKEEIPEDLIAVGHIRVYDSIREIHESHRIFLKPFAGKNLLFLEGGDGKLLIADLGKFSHPRCGCYNAKVYPYYFNVPRILGPMLIGGEALES